MTSISQTNLISGMANHVKRDLLVTNPRTELQFRIIQAGEKGHVYLGNFIVDNQAPCAKGILAWAEPNSMPNLLVNCYVISATRARPLILSQEERDSNGTLTLTIPADDDEFDVF